MLLAEAHLLFEAQQHLVGDELLELLRLLFIFKGREALELVTMIPVHHLEVDVGDWHLVAFENVSRVLIDHGFCLRVVRTLLANETTDGAAQPSAARSLLFLLHGDTVDCAEDNLQEDVVTVLVTNVSIL